MEVDWDLQAVVRGCTFASADPPPSSINQTDEEILSSAHFGFASDCFFTNNTLDQLFHFHPTTNHHAPPPPLHHPQPREDLFDELYFPASADPRVVSLSPTPVEPKREIPKPALHPATPLRSKRRRKSQIKKVCEVPAEGLSSDDTWSWRKYGQKPIKGSPYPRGYYRCSSSKGCPARKQLERNRSDPDMFIVTYTAEHNHPAPTHRNSLAGTTRHHHKRNILPITTNQQQEASKPTTTSSSSVPTSTSPSDDDADVQQSTKTAENQFDGMDDGGLFLLDDGFFDGLDGEIAGDGCCWFANSTTRS